MKVGAHPSHSPSGAAQTREGAVELRKMFAEYRPEPRPTFVYFVATVDRSLVKIGSTVDPETRFLKLLGGSPIPLEMLAAVPGNRHEEWALHRHYLAQHSRYEWFHLTPEMLADIAAIAHSGELPAAFRGANDTKNPLSQFSMRATPEFSARMSVIRKECWAEIRRERASKRAISEQSGEA